MIRISFFFPLANGLHARPASQLREACLPFAAKVIFRNLKRRRRADATSVLDLVASGTLAGDPCCLEISGPKEREAAAALRSFVERELPRAGDEAPPPPRAARDYWLPPGLLADPGRRLPGTALSAGSGSGRALPMAVEPRLSKRFAAGMRDARRERRLFEAARRQVESDLDELARKTASRQGAAILEAQQAMLVDPGFSGRIAQLIEKEGFSAGAAIERTVACHTAILRRAAGSYMRERVADLNDVAALLAGKLYARPQAAPVAGSGPVVLVASSLSPSELLRFDRRRLRGLVLGETGQTAHIAILARSLDIPAVSLPTEHLALIPAGAETIVDGRRSLVVTNPGPVWRRYIRMEGEQRRRLGRRRLHLAAQPGRMRDGIRVEVAANIGNPTELDAAWRQGAEGIGLFRSEFLFLERDEPPSEQEQYLAYARAVRSARGRPVIVRTLDIGGDKPLPYLCLPRGENPYLGCRAIRFYAEHAELIRCQLRAALRAARFGELKIMAPMVVSADEVRLLRRLLETAAAELRRRRVAHRADVELGVMIETPAAALSVDLLAREADFFSIGSNDLLQYTMAADRGDASLAGLHNPLHPAFLRLLRQVASQARRCRRWLGLCGEMAGRADLLPLLVGMGFTELSMAPALIPPVKERLAGLERDGCRQLLARALQCADAGEVAALLAGFVSRTTSRPPLSNLSLIRLASPCRSASEAIQELCTMLETEDRVNDAAALEEAVWKREETYATDLGFGFALPHAKSPAVRTASVAFLRPRRPFRWSAAETQVRGVLLIAIPEAAAGQEHLRIIAHLSRRLMNEDFRAALLTAPDGGAVLAALRSGFEST